MKVHIKKENMLLLVLILVSLSIRLAISSVGVPTALSKFADDDAFYYLKITENFVGGKGFSFDGLVQTNGFHPLYILISSPFFLIFKDLIARYHLSLILLNIFSVATAIFIYKLTRLFVTPIFALLSTTFWLYNPFTSFLALNGEEIAIAGFFIAATLYYFVNLIKYKRFDVKSCSILGMLLALTVLARSDGILLFIAVILMIVLLNRKSFPMFIKTVTPILTMFILILLPWVIWNLNTFGTIAQDSAVAQKYLNHITIIGTDSLTVLQCMKYGSYNILAAIGKIILIVGGGNISNKVIHGILNHFHTALFLVVVVTLMILLLANIKELWKGICNNSSIALLFTIYILFFLYYPIILWGNWYRYYAPILLITSILFGILLSFLHKRFKFKQLYVLDAIIIILLFVFSSYYIIRNLDRSWQKEYYAGAIWLRNNISSTEIIGAFNSGIFGYFSGRTVVNLDGKVNGEALRAIKNKSFNEYLRRKNITVLIDQQSSLSLYDAQSAYLSNYSFRYRVNNSSIVVMKLKDGKFGGVWK
ncbi:glycosyltransferase family 39 protein [bacterium]|nr:glycosyltransferase family 39 protein [bacterium]